MRENIEHLPERPDEHVAPAPKEAGASIPEAPAPHAAVPQSVRTTVNGLLSMYEYVANDTRLPYEDKRDALRALTRELAHAFDLQLEEPDLRHLTNKEKANLRRTFYNGIPLKNSQAVDKDATKALLAQAHPALAEIYGARSTVSEKIFDMAMEKFLKDAPNAPMKPKIED